MFLFSDDSLICTTNSPKSTVICTFDGKDLKDIRQEIQEGEVEVPEDFFKNGFVFEILVSCFSYKQLCYFVDFI